jgi:hypothetical protein
MQLDHVHLVNVQQVQRAADLIVGGPFCALVGFRRQEEGLAVPPNPIAQKPLGLTVAGGNVDMVYSVLQEQLHCGVDLILRGIRKCGCAKDRAGAAVTGSSKRKCGYHGLLQEKVGDRLLRTESVY